MIRPTRGEREFRMPKAIVAVTAEDPAVQEYHRTIRAVGTQSMRELDKLDHDELRRRASVKAKTGVASRKPPPAVEAEDTGEHDAVK